jgi:ribonuclease Z
MRVVGVNASSAGGGGASRKLRVGELREALRDAGVREEEIKGKLKADLVAMYDAMGVDAARMGREGTTGSTSEEGPSSRGEVKVEDDGGTRTTSDNRTETNSNHASSSSFQQTIFNTKTRGAVAGGDEIERERKSNFSGVELTFLGTSSGAPSFTRNVSSLALRLDNEIWLFDCGEATQHQLMRSQLKYAKISKIFVTHMHGDHIFGLPGLICAISGTRTAHSKVHGTKAEPLHIIGPPGIRQFIYSSITWSRSVLGMPLVVTELRHSSRAGGAPTAPHTSVDPRGKIFMGEYSPDNEAEPAPHFKDERAWTELGASGRLPVWTVYNDGELCVRATPLRHPVPCFGYIVDECDQPGRLDADKAMAMGLPPGREYRLLKEGKSVETASGVVINPEDVIGADRPGRRLVLLGDTCNSSAMLQLGRGADALVHESTFNTEKTTEALFKGHSTATMAGEFAANIRARSLILTHFSNRYAGGFQGDREDVNASADFGASVDEEDDCADMMLPELDGDSIDDEDVAQGERMHVDTLVDEAIQAKGDNRVVAASDFFVFNVRRRESPDAYDSAKGDRSVLFAGPRKTTPKLVVVEDHNNARDDADAGDHHHHHHHHNPAARHGSGRNQHPSSHRASTTHASAARSSRSSAGASPNAGGPNAVDSARSASRPSASSRPPRRVAIHRSGRGGPNPGTSSSTNTRGGAHPSDGGGSRTK